MNVYMATSEVLRQHSHGKGMGYLCWRSEYLDVRAQFKRGGTGIDAVIEAATEVIEFVKSKGLEIRFSCEDSFRSDRTDLLKVYSRSSWCTGGR